VKTPSIYESVFHPHFIYKTVGSSVSVEQHLHLGSLSLCKVVFVVFLLFLAVFSVMLTFFLTYIYCLQVLAEGETVAACEQCLWPQALEEPRCHLTTVMFSLSTEHQHRHRGVFQPTQEAINNDGNFV
jgi:hypothetical protein